MDRDATLFVTQNLMLRRELQFLGTYMATGVWTGSSTGGDISPSTQWDSNAADPMYDVDFQKQYVKSQTGYMPNTLLVSPDVFFALRNCPAVLDRIKYTQRGVVTTDLLAEVLGVEKFLVAYGVVNTAAEGATFAGQYITKNQALLVYANPAPSILQPSGGYIFSWQGLYGAGAYGNRIKSFRMEPLASDRIEGEMSFAMKLVSADVGMLFVNVLGTP
jgi:hypothetical protein